MCVWTRRKSKQIADVTRGVHFHVGNAGDLKKIYHPPASIRQIPGYLRFLRQTLISACTLAAVPSRSSETESRKSASAFDFDSV